MTLSLTTELHSFRDRSCCSECSISNQVASKCDGISSWRVRIFYNGQVSAWGFIRNWRSCEIFRIGFPNEFDFEHVSNYFSKWNYCSFQVRNYFPVVKAVRKFSKSALSNISSLYGIPFGSSTSPSDSNSSAPGGTNDRIWKESTDGLEFTRIWKVLVEYRRGLSIWDTAMITTDLLRFHIRIFVTILADLEYKIIEIGIRPSKMKLIWVEYENFPRQEYQLMQSKVLTYPQ